MATGRSRCLDCLQDLERHNSRQDHAVDRLHGDRCWLSPDARSSYRESCIEAFAGHRWGPLAGCCLAGDGTCCCNGVESILSLRASSQLGPQLLLHRWKRSRMPLVGLNDRCSEAHVFHFSAACHAVDRWAHYQATLAAAVAYRQERDHTSQPTSGFCFACNSRHVAQEASSWLHREPLEAAGLTRWHSPLAAISGAIAGCCHITRSGNILAALWIHFALEPSFPMPLGASFDWYLGWFLGGAISQENHPEKSILSRARDWSYPSTCCWGCREVEEPGLLSSSGQASRWVIAWSGKAPGPPLCRAHSHPRNRPRRIRPGRNYASGSRQVCWPSGVSLTLRSWVRPLPFDWPLSFSSSSRCSHLWRLTHPASCYLLAISSFGHGQASPLTLYSSKIFGLELPLCQPHAPYLPGPAFCSFWRLRHCCWLTPTFLEADLSGGLALLPLQSGCCRRCKTPLDSTQPSSACCPYLSVTWCPSLPSCRS